MHGTAHSFTLLCSLEGHDSNNVSRGTSRRQQNTGHALPWQLLSLSWEGITGEEYLRWDVHPALPDLCPSERPDRILYNIQFCEMSAQVSPLVASASCLVYEISQPDSWTAPQMEENTSPSLQAHSTPVTAAEVTMEKNSSVWESTAVNLPLRFIIRNKEECKRPSCFLGSHSGLPQPTTAAAPAPPNCSLLFCWTALGAFNQWVQLIYIDLFQLCIKSQNHSTLKHGSFNLTLSGFSLLLLARPLYFLIHVRKLSQIVSQGKKNPTYIILCRMPKSPSLQGVMQ